MPSVQPCAEGIQIWGQTERERSGGCKVNTGLLSTLETEVKSQFVLCNCRSLKQAPTWKKWNSSLLWTGFRRDIASTYCYSLRYFTTSGEMDAKEINTW